MVAADRLETARTQGFVILAALACAKVGGLNLLPLMPLNGGMALLYLLGWRTDVQQGGAVDAYMKASVLALLAVVALWLVGAFVFVRAR